MNHPGPQGFFIVSRGRRGYSGINSSSIKIIENTAGIVAWAAKPYHYDPFYEPESMRRCWHSFLFPIHYGRLLKVSEGWNVHKMAIMTCGKWISAIFTAGFVTLHSQDFFFVHLWTLRLLTESNIQDNWTLITLAEEEQEQWLQLGFNLAPLV